MFGFNFDLNLRPSTFDLRLYWTIMLSRVAESLFWMSRYIERAENVARFIDVNFHLILDGSTLLGEEWKPLIYTTGDHEDFDAAIFLIAGSRGIGLARAKLAIAHAAHARLGDAAALERILHGHRAVTGQVPIVAM